MIVTYNIGILAAKLKLTALSSHDGRVIRHEIQWQLESADSEQSHDNPNAQAEFVVTEGSYRIFVHYREEKLDLGLIELQKNTLTDAIFILNNGEFVSGGDYFSDYDAQVDFIRRSTERELQSEHGSASMPLRDPDSNIQGEMGAQVMAHPLLADKAQFDGVPPDMRPDPSENKEAVELTLSAQLTNAPGMTSSPTPSPVGG